MILNFAKLPFNPVNFEYSKDDCAFNGVLVKRGRMKLGLDGELVGFINVACDVCADEFKLIVNEKLKLTIVNEVLSNHEDLDTIEILEEEVNIKEIIDLEIENIKIDYNYCKSCSSKNEFYV